MAGWIKLHRSIQDSAISAHPEYLAVWVHILLRAQYSASTCVTGRSIVRLEAGQLMFGRIKFAAQVGISEAKVRAALDVMKSLDMITIKSMAKYSIISITNWQKYQEDSQQITTEKPSSNHQATIKQPSNDHIQESKEVKEVKNSLLVSPSAHTAAPKKTELDYSQWPNMPSKQTMTDWLAMRKRLKAPISQTVINRFAIELKKAKAYGYTVDQCLAECVTRGWRGFETQWLVNSAQNGQYKTAAEKAAERNESTFDYERARDF